MRKAALHNLGCKVNSYETEAMQQMLEASGYEIVSFQEEADVYLINTCSVTNIADRKSRQMIHRARKKNPRAVIVAAGCYVQTACERGEQDGAIDIVIGNNKKHELVSLLEEYFAGQNGVSKKKTKAVIDINDPGESYEELHLERTAEHTRAFIKVQDGCNQFCTYCIIPYARGRVRSRRAEDVLAEIRKLAENGYREVVLTGIHLSSYGIDRGDSLLHLIEEVHGIEGIERIRLGSLEPKIVTEEFAGRLAQLPKICPHFHLSLQSGCDETLRRMNRKYTTAEYEEGCNILRKHFEHPAITTDVIVGFPGETQEEFLATKEYLERIHFYEMHIFKYSRREGTRAAVMPDQIPEQVKSARSNELLALAQKMSGEFREDYLGREVEALMEEKTTIDGVEYYVGFTREYVKLAVPSGENLTNRFVRGRIEKALTEEIYLIKLEF